MSPATETEAPDLRRSLSGELSAMATLFVLTIRQNTHGRRVFVLAFLYALPCALVILIRSLNPPPPMALETGFIFMLLTQGLAPLTALLYSAGIIQSEVEEQTLTYLLMRSMPRWGLYLSKLAATWLVTSALVGIATAALYLTIYAGTPEFTTEQIPLRMIRAIAIMSLGQAAYCALFGFIGLCTRRSLMFGIAYIVMIEGFMANVDFIARKLTVAYYIRVLFLRWLELPERFITRFQRQWSLNLTIAPSALECMTTLLIAAFVIGVVSAIWFSQREFRMKTPGD